MGLWAVYRLLIGSISSCEENEKMGVYNDTVPSLSLFYSLCVCVCVCVWERVEERERERERV